MFRSDVPRRIAVKELGTAMVVIVVSTGVYFALPLGTFGETATWAAVAGFAVGVLAISSLIERQVRRYRSGAASITGVLAALYLAVLFFSAVYFGLAFHHPPSIASLHTKLDALYFSLTITSTVGFGDVHAVSQAARALVAVHIFFNVAFLGAAISVVRASTQLRRAG